MKQWFKRGLFTVVFLVIVALIGAAVFLLTFDPNAYKTKVEQLVYERYQRELRIDGEIELSLFPRIGLAVEQVSLSNRNSSEPFASIDSARFAVAVWPLLWDRLVVDHVAVSGFKVWLNRDTEGNYDFMDLLHGGAPDVEEPISRSDETEFQIDIAGLDLKAGEIHFTDAQSHTNMRVVALDVNTGRMTFGQPFDVIYKGRLVGDSPTADAVLEGQTVLQLEPHLRHYMAQRVNVLLKGKVASYKGQMNLTLGQLNMRRSLAELSAEKLKLRINASWRNEAAVSEHKVELALDLPQLSLAPDQVKSAPIAFSFKESQGEALFGINARIKALSGDYAQTKLEQLHIDIAGRQAETAWKIDVSSAVTLQRQSEVFMVQWQDMSANLRVDDERLGPNPVNATVTGAGQLQRTALEFDGLWQSANTEAQFKSRLNHDAHWKLALDVNAKSIDVNPWLPKPLFLDGAAKKSQPVMLLDRIDWATVSKQLHVKADTFSAFDVLLEGVNLELEQTEGQVQITQAQAELFDGSLNATGSWQPQTAQAALNASLTDISLLPFFRIFDAKPSLDGQGSITLDLHAQGHNPQAWRETLDGTLQIKARDGRVVGWSFWQQLHQANDAVRNVFSGQVSMPEAQFDALQFTPFEALRIDAAVQKGQISMRKFDWKGAGLKLEIEPESVIDLVNQRLAISLRADLQKKTLPAAEADLVSYASHPVYMGISGPLTDPSYSVLWQRLDHPAVQEAINNGLLELLESPDLNTLIQDTGPDPIPSAPSVVEDAAKALGNTLKELLN